jgi:tetratricopeptide (TPR) repeat protein
LSKRYALLIAADDYSNSSFSKLRAPAHDAEELARVLSDPAIGGFEVTPLLNRTAPEAKTEIERFFLHRNPDDILVLYFSCHGYKDEEGLLYFAMPKTETSLLDSTAVEASFVNRQMEKSLSKHIVLILDCCYSGAFARGFATRSGSMASVNSQEAFQGKGKVVITSSDALQYSFENGEMDSGKPELGIFTDAVVRGLRSGDADLDGDGWVSTEDLYRFADQQVISVVPSQHPTRFSMLEGGDILLARSVKQQRVPAAAQPKSKLTTEDQPAYTGGDQSANVVPVEAPSGYDVEPATDEMNAHYDRGLRFARERDRTAAVSEFERVVGVGPSKLADLATFDLAALAAQAGNLETATSFYATAVQSSNQVVAARASLNLGCLYLAADLMDEAISILNEAMSYHDAAVESRAAFLLGQLYERRGDLPKAWLLYGISADHVDHPFVAEAKSRYLALTPWAGEKAAVTRILDTARFPNPVANALLACARFYQDRDLSRARSYYRELANLGDPEFGEIADQALEDIARAARQRAFRFWKRSSPK